MTDRLLARWLRLAGARIAAARELLTDLDAAIGDGDHGINLDRGFRELVRRLDGGLHADDPPAVVLEGAGRVLIGTVGGASGALYGHAFQRAGAALLMPSAADPGPGAAGPAPRTREADAAIAFGAAVGAIVALGRASVGEKTMLDALAPACAELDAAVKQGAGLGLAARRAAEAAEAGAQATIPLLATKGRASYLGDRSIGHLDPGAMSSAILLRALADAAAEA